MHFWSFVTGNIQIISVAIGSYQNLHVDLHHWIVFRSVIPQTCFIKLGLTNLWGN